MTAMLAERFGEPKYRSGNDTCCSVTPTPTSLCCLVEEKSISSLYAGFGSIGTTSRCDRLSGFFKEEIPRMTFHLKVCTVTLVLIVALAVSAAAAGPAVTWSKLSTPNSPSARSGSAMTYDPISKKIVLFGGFSASGYLNDTWTFDGKTWTKQSTPTAPPSRTASTMPFDRVARQVVMFGGYNGHNYLGDTWTWDGATSTWSQASPTNSPEAVTSPMLFTDPLSGRVDVFGGFDGQFYQLTTYQWTGTDWKKLNPPATAFARSTAIVALNQVTKKVVMFGGLGDVNTFNTWTWDGTTWAQNTPATQPPNRYISAGVFGGCVAGVFWAHVVPTHVHVLKVFTSPRPPNITTFFVTWFKATIAVDRANAVAGGFNFFQSVPVH